MVWTIKMDHGRQYKAWEEHEIMLEQIRVTLKIIRHCKEHESKMKASWVEKNNWPL